MLINEVEELDNIKASFAVGTPNFQYAGIVDPLFIGQTLTQLSQQISAANARQATNSSSFLAQQTFSNSNYQSEGSRAGIVPTLIDVNDPQGDRHEDLFFYHQDHITLKRGERSRHTLLSEKVPYESIYELKPPDPMEVDEYGNHRAHDQEKKDFIPVWHAVRLDNLGKNPWTTGVAFVTKSGLPLAEDTMPHTLAGEKGIVRLALARGVVADEQLKEISRQQVNILQSNYFRVTVEGKIRIRNAQQMPVKLCVSKSLVGEIKNISDQGKSIKVIKKLNGINPTSELSWDLVLDPKAEKELQYSYEVVLR